MGVCAMKEVGVTEMVRPDRCRTSSRCQGRRKRMTGSLLLALAYDVYMAFGKVPDSYWTLNFAFSCRGLISKMCYFIEITYIPTRCTSPVKHKISKVQVDSSQCSKSRRTGLACVGNDLKPALGLNGEVIQLGSYHRPLPCARCFS